MMPAVMTSGSDIIAIAPATHPNDGDTSAAGFGGGAAAARGAAGGGGSGTKRGAAGGGDACGFGAGRAVSDR